MVAPYNPYSGFQVGDYIPVSNEESIFAPQAQFLRRAYAGLPDHYGPGSTPGRQIVQQQLRTAFDPAMGRYQLATLPNLYADRQNISFGEYLDAIRPSGIDPNTGRGFTGSWAPGPARIAEQSYGGIGDVMQGWEDLVSFSRGYEGMDPEKRELDVRAKYLTGDPALQIARYAMGGPTRGYLGRMHADRAENVRREWQNQQMLRGINNPQSFLGYLASILPETGTMGGGEFYSPWVDRPQGYALTRPADITATATAPATATATDVINPPIDELTVDEIRATNLRLFGIESDVRLW